jgi:glutathione peroxidase
MSTANNTVPLSDANMTLTDEGRVFTRLLRFRSFPDDLQADTKAFQAFVVQNKANVFQMHHTVRMKSVYSVKGKELIEHIEKWLQDRGTGVPVSAELHARARQIADSLVLSGFLTPLNDDEKHVNAPTPEHYVHNNELLIPVAEEVSALNTTSVWSVLEGASYAKVLKRKAGVRAHFSSGKDVYVVFNKRTKKAYLFESDLAREPIVELDGEGLNVQFDDATFEFGVRVTAASGDDKNVKPELFNSLTKPLQEEFLNEWINIGAHYREAYNVDVESAKSIYQLMDRDIYGNPVTLDKYKGKVLLVVNVASRCQLASVNYAELAILHEKYREQGFEVLAFPCNQFASLEPGTNEEIVSFAKHYNAQFQLFEKADVNGARARPVFTFLKAKLPGTFGSFVKWNFTKFLVDRNGMPFKRFAPTDKPFSLEGDIKLLLSVSTHPVEPLRTAKVNDAENMYMSENTGLPAATGASSTKAPDGMHSSSTDPKDQEWSAREPAPVAP